jgi:Ricin-type beta-trefoil lectin domain/Beta-1,3-glucanase
MKHPFRRRAVLAAVLTLATASAGVIAISTYGASAATSVTGQITGMDGKCIGAAAGKTDNGTRVDVYSCVGDATQQWTFPGDGTIRNSGKCMDVAGAATADGTAVQLYDCNNTPAQQWVYSSGRDLVNPNANKCLDMSGNTSADFTVTVIWTCTGGANQKWTIPSGTSGPTATATATSNPTGDPSSFWGDTSTIPAASNVMTFKILNRTNGKYPDSQVFWTFNGQTHSIAEQQYIDMPVASAARMYFHLGSASSQYVDFIEFNTTAAWIGVNTTRVDGFGLKMALKVHTKSGSDATVGEDAATFAEDRTATFQKFINEVPTEFKGLAQVNAPYNIPAPGAYAPFQSGGQYQSYMSSYASSLGYNVTSHDIFACAGTTLQNNAAVCGALNRHVAQLATSQWSNTSMYYQSAPANYYAKFWHDHAIDRKAYGFPYDDSADQSSYIASTNPQYMVVAVGW